MRSHKRYDKNPSIVRTPNYSIIFTFSIWSGWLDGCCRDMRYIFDLPKLRVSMAMSAYVLPFYIRTHTCVCVCARECVYLEYVIAFYIAMIMRKIVWESDTDSATFYMLVSCCRPTTNEKSIHPLHVVPHFVAAQINGKFRNLFNLSHQTLCYTECQALQMKQSRCLCRFGLGKMCWERAHAKIHYNKINCVLKFHFNFFWKSFRPFSSKRKTRNLIEMKFQ